VGQVERNIQTVAKKQMSQLKEVMKEKKDTVKQDITTKCHDDVTNDPPSVSESHDPTAMSSHDTGITVEITMCKLSASNLEVSEITYANQNCLYYPICI